MDNTKVRYTTKILLGVECYILLFDTQEFLSVGEQIDYYT